MGQLMGIKISHRAPAISGLLFADDSIIFAEANPFEANIVKDILKEYECASGQVINFVKSEVCFSKNAGVGIKKDIMDIMGVKGVKNHTKYLGLPLEFGHNRAKAFDDIERNISNKINGWKEGLLSNGDKEIMIKAVLQAMPQYAMSCLLLPKTKLEKIRKAITNFWWNKKRKGKVVHWVKWEKLVECKEDGGLGFKDFEALNMAFIGKQIWRCLVRENSLMARVLKAKYFNRCSILDAGLGSNPSYCWRSIHSAIKIVRKGAMFSEFSGSWRWRFEASGEYSVKSAYNIALSSIRSMRGEGTGEQSSQIEKKQFWNSIWSSNVPNRIKHCCWRFFGSSLPDAPGLNKRGIWVDDKCFMCGNAKDSALHCVANCIWSRRFWDELDLGRVWLEKLEGDAGDWMWWWHKKLSKTDFEKFMVGIWMLWRCRNQARFGDSSWSPEQAANYGENYRKEFIRANKCLSSDLLVSKTAWDKPGEGVVKINSDGAYIAGEGRGGGAFVAQDHNGNFIYGECWPEVRARSALETEVRALHKAFLWAVRKGLDKVVFESDCLRLVEAIVKGWSLPGDLKTLTSFFNSVLETRPAWTCHHVLRSGNILADQFASMGSTGILQHFYYHNIPSLQADQLALEARPSHT